MSQFTFPVYARIRENRQACGNLLLKAGYQTEEERALYDSLNKVYGLLQEAETIIEKL